MSKTASTVVAGLLIRGHVRRMIRGAAHARGLELTLDEDRGTFESVFLVTAEGPDAKVLDFTRWLVALMASLD